MPRSSTALVSIAIAMVAAGSSQAADRYVSFSGRDTTLIGQPNTCLDVSQPCRTIQYAIDQAGGADTIKVQGGAEYLEHLSISGAYSDLEIQGGWSSGFTERSDDPFLTRINGTLSGRILDIEVDGVVTSVTIQNFTFYRGAAASGPADGGAIRLVASSGAGADLSIESCDFVENTANRYGGAVSVRNSFAVVGISIRKSTFRDNTAGSNGGGVNIRSGSPAPTEAEFVNNFFTGNSSGNWGGGVGIFSGVNTVTFTNNTVTGNTATSGGALVLDSFYDETSTVDVANSTLSGNDAPNDVLIYEVDSATYDSVAILNATHSNMGRVFINNAAQGEGIYNDDGTNLDVDPGFVDPDADDYHLAATSDLVDAGICSITTCFPRPFPLPPVCTIDPIAPPDDFEGDPRPETSGGACDVGADEYVPEPAAALLQATVLLALGLQRSLRRARSA